MTSEDIVRTFCTSWESRDLAALLGAVSEDLVYQNVPRPPLVGKPAFEAFIGPILAATRAIDFIVKSLATSADGKMVLTERIDRLHYADGTVEVPLMGIFQIEGGLIVRWRDYPDSAHVAAQFAALGGAGGD